MDNNTSSLSPLSAAPLVLIGFLSLVPILLIASVVRYAYVTWTTRAHRNRRRRAGSQHHAIELTSVTTAGDDNTASTPESAPFRSSLPAPLRPAHLAPSSYDRDPPPPYSPLDPRTSSLDPRASFLAPPSIDARGHAIVTPSPTVPVEPPPLAELP
ncbi:hypothetical protein GGR52DRAFT_568823 [Hypoxylon sp. FL1284]|nr:hypothetical protein GGR52DRAFT_568823 [Hypoxylon sp. FL1284]